MQGKRIASIDLFRAFGIICMIMGHINFGRHFFTYIQAFHMPMFYFVSGYFFQDKGWSFPAYVRKKARSLLLPYCTFGELHLILDIPLSGFSAEKMKSQLFHLLLINTEGLPIAGALWFLTSLFFVEVLYLLLNRGVSSGTLRILLILLIAAAGSNWVALVPFRLPLVLDTAFVGLLFYLSGHEFRLHQEKPLTAKRLSDNMLLNAAGLVLNGLLIFHNVYVDMRTGSYPHMILSWFNALCAIIIYWNITMRLERIRRHGIWDTGMNFLKSIGKNSIVYVVTNQIVILLLTKLTDRLPLPVLIRDLMILLFSVLIMYGLSVILTRTRLSVLIGKPQSIQR